MNIYKLLKEAFRAGFNYSDDMNTKGFADFLDKHKEAINLIQCSEQLKVDDKMNFEDWVKNQGYVKTKGKDEYRKGMIRSDDFNLKHNYTKYLNL